MAAALQRLVEQFQVAQDAGHPQNGRAVEAPAPEETAPESARRLPHPVVNGRAHAVAGKPG